jgi:hypothetical protein
MVICPTQKGMLLSKLPCWPSVGDTREPSCSTPSDEYMLYLYLLLRAVYFLSRSYSPLVLTAVVRIDRITVAAPRTLATVALPTATRAHVVCES